MPIDLTPALREEARSNATAQEGIVIDERNGDCVRYVAYAPGNGTQYRLLLASVPCIGRAAADLGATDDSVAVTLIGPRVGFACLRRNGALLHHDYVAEKFAALSAADVVAVTELLGYVLDRPTSVGLSRQ